MFCIHSHLFSELFESLARRHPHLIRQRHGRLVSHWSALQFLRGPRACASRRPGTTERAAGSCGRQQRYADTSIEWHRHVVVFFPVAILAVSSFIIIFFFVCFSFFMCHPSGLYGATAASSSALGAFLTSNALRCTCTSAYLANFIFSCLPISHKLRCGSILPPPVIFLVAASIAAHAPPFSAPRLWPSMRRIRANRARLGPQSPRRCAVALEILRHTLARKKNIFTQS